MGKIAKYVIWQELILNRDSIGGTETKASELQDIDENLRRFRDLTSKINGFI